jgi:hypothetical protein
MDERRWSHGEVCPRRATNSDGLIPDWARNSIAGFDLYAIRKFLGLLNSRGARRKKTSSEKFLSFLNLQNGYSFTWLLAN